MFDVVALNAISVECFETNWSSAAGTLIDVEIWTRNGTHVGFTDDANAWTLVGMAPSVSVSGPNLPTYLPIDVDVPIAMADTQAFYIVTSTTSTNNRYTDGSVLGAVLASDANAQILEGTGCNYPFGFSLSPREFNGTMYYSTVPTGIVGSVMGSSFRAWPDGSGGLNVEVPQKMQGSIQIVDLGGHVLFDDRVQGGRSSISLGINGISAGIYLAIFTAHDQRISTRFLIH